MDNTPKAPVTISANGGSTQNKKANGGEQSNRETYALVCYHYPQYKLEDVQEMPARDVNLLLSTAYKQKALDYIHQVQITASPHSKKGEAIKKLIDEYKKIVET